jgi:hypothetical protein
VSIVCDRLGTVLQKSLGVLVSQNFPGVMIGK